MKPREIPISAAARKRWLRKLDKRGLASLGWGPPRQAFEKKGEM